MERLVERRTPLVPIGSLMIWTSTSWPFWISVSIGSRFSSLGESSIPSTSSPAISLQAATSLVMSEAWRKPLRSSPMSTKAAWIAGRTFRTTPL